jgi:uncharacterized protein YdiU (UPF0061 family)
LEPGDDFAGGGAVVEHGVDEVAEGFGEFGDFAVELGEGRGLRVGCRGNEAGIWNDVCIGGGEDG